jgi:transposase
VSYRAWVGHLDLVMRQEHRAGEKLFVDYAGQTVPITDRHSGELRPAAIFVAVLGASSYTYLTKSSPSLNWRTVMPRFLKVSWLLRCRLAS